MKGLINPAGLDYQETIDLIDEYSRYHAEGPPYQDGNRRALAARR